MDNLKKSDRNQEGEVTSFQDPAKKGWVWFCLFVLVLGMTPFWPITGDILGYPKWVVFAVFMGFLTSVFVAVVIIFIWKDSGSNKG